MVILDQCGKSPQQKWLKCSQNAYLTNTMGFSKNGVGLVSGLNNIFRAGVPPPPSPFSACIICEQPLMNSPEHMTLFNIFPIWICFNRINYIINVNFMLRKKTLSVADTAPVKGETSFH